MICTYGYECVFGKIIHGEMQLNANGSIADKCWKEIPRHFQNVELDEYVIMPNHIHGIIILHDHSRDVQLNVPTRLSPRKGTLSVIIRTFKAAVTTECHNNYVEFRWQPRFYEHIIRNQKELNKIRVYINNNIIKWSSDTENLQNIPL
jgi:REP element-mobilizing transposase RayT